MNTQDVLRIAAGHLSGMPGHAFDVIDVAKPKSAAAALNLAKIISKLSPLVGNLIEFNTVDLLNLSGQFATLGKWERQDPGFPDTIFRGLVHPTPGLEIKAWFPFATEITARFKDSQNFFADDNTFVALLAWLPEHVIFGRPKIVGACIVSALSVAMARDHHYHKPPDYLILEPENTTERTRNLQQTNTSGYKWQGSRTEFLEAQRIVSEWGPNGHRYAPTVEYQAMLRTLVSRFNYRLDTNFAKMDRIAHDELEAFKSRVLMTSVAGLTVKQWGRLLNGSEDALQQAITTRLAI